MEERLDLFSTLFPSVLTALRFACEHVNFLPFRRTPRGVFSFDLAQNMIIGLAVKLGKTSN